MLTTGRRSRLRLTLGGTAVTALMIGGLVATASGTPAAATVRAGVEKATGIDIAAIDAKVAAKLQSSPPAPPAAPEGAALPEPVAAPAAPVAAEPPAAPAAPAAAEPPTPPAAPWTVAVDSDGRKADKRFKLVLVDKDGKAAAQDWSVQMNASIPDVRSTNCRGGSNADREMVINKTDGKKRVIIICEDRIERVVAMSKANMERSKDAQRAAYAHALESLHHAREGIASNPNMSAEAKREALDSIDDSIKDMEADTARSD